MTTISPDMTAAVDSDTLDSVLSPPPTSRPRRRGYLRWWARAPREVGFLLGTLPFVIASFVVSVAAVAVGAATAVIVAGFFVLAAGLWMSRGLGTMELRRLERAGFPEIPKPQWNGKRSKPGAVGWLARYLGNGHYWLYLLHGVVNFAIGLTTWVLTVTALALSLGGLSYWFWGRFLPPHQGTANVWLHEVILRAVSPDIALGTTEEALFRGEAVFYAVMGVVFLLILPFVFHGLVAVHYAIACAMLSSFPSDRLEREVAELGASRSAAVSAEDQSLRRLERDIHDGPQQRLVRLQFDLASAERAIESNPDEARLLLSGAMAQSRETLEELRELSRGFAPPLLQDRGLAVALESLAARSVVPVTLRLSLEEELGPIPQEIERSAYFIAAELLANVAKHSGATMANLQLVHVQVPPSGERMLVVTVFDDGAGGASLVVGHGLEGLAERLRGLRSELQVTSPRGGPTLISARIPLS